MDTETRESFKTLLTIIKDLQIQFSSEVFGMGIAATYAAYLYGVAKGTRDLGRDENEAYEEGIGYLKKAIEAVRNMDDEEKRKDEIDAIDEDIRKHNDALLAEEINQEREAFSLWFQEWQPLIGGLNEELCGAAKKKKGAQSKSKGLRK